MGTCAYIIKPSITDRRIDGTVIFRAVVPRGSVEHHQLAAYIEHYGVDPANRFEHMRLSEDDAYIEIEHTANVRNVTEIRNKAVEFSTVLRTSFPLLTDVAIH